MSARQSATDSAIVSPSALAQRSAVHEALWRSDRMGDWMSYAPPSSTITQSVS
jgi:hypothetical protein